MVKINLMLITFIWYAAIPTWPAVAKPAEGYFRIQLNKHWLLWKYNWYEKWIKFQVQVYLQPMQWFAIGFSDRGEMNNADFCIYHTNLNGDITLTDAWTDDKCLLEIDTKQDCLNFEHKTDGNLTMFIFSREFDTCDLNDYTFEQGTTHIVWARGTGDVVVGRSLCDQEEEGMIRTTLTRVELETKMPKDTWPLGVTVSEVEVPNSDTTYWCHTADLPEKVVYKKHHLIRFEPIIQQGHHMLVHHMELFHCEIPQDEELEDYSGPCNTKPQELEVCKKVLAAWAMGASPFNYPEVTGLPVGGDGYSTQVMLEIHYNNPEKLAGRIDNSGLRIYLTPTLRKFDAGVIELGLEYTDKMAIPPHLEKFQLTGHCISECTSVGVPFRGIWIFASQLHTHLTGTRVETILVRKGVEISRLDWDNHYSPHYQEIRLLRNKTYVFPGNALYTRCTYNTENRDKITLGGFATSDEMCVNYIYYYPKINLEVCKSSISDHDLFRYFKLLDELENQRTYRKPISEAYNSIEWNPMRVAVLNRLYQESRISMQCNKSDGDRFPGFWYQMPVTTILHKLPPFTKCIS